MTGPPLEDEASEDLAEALTRLAEEAERLPPVPRPSRKTLVPWRGQTEQQDAAPQATTLKDTDEHPHLEANPSLAGTPPAPLPAVEQAPPLPRSEATTDPRLATAATPTVERLARPLPSRLEAPFALELVGGPGAGQVVPVGKRSAMVGRVMGAVRVDDPFVSDGHASFAVRGGELVVVDGGTPSGLYVSAPRQVPLAPGQCFAVGLQVFRYLGPVVGPGRADAYGAPFPRRAHRVEHLLVGDRSGRVALFRYSASIGRVRGTFQFPDDVLLDEVHAELRPGDVGMELLTHGRGPAFLKVATGAEVKLRHGELVRIGTSTLRVVDRLLDGEA